MINMNRTIVWAAVLCAIAMAGFGGTIPPPAPSPETLADPTYRRLMKAYEADAGTLDRDTVRAEWKKLHEDKAGTIDRYKKQHFGMFIHWGLYSVLGGEYKGQPGGAYAEWIAYGKEIPFAEYDQLAAQFNPVNYDPDEWVRMAKEAGMKYMVITAKHHEGFALFRSKVSRWNMVDATPYKKDVVAMLHDAARAEGMDFGLYYSHNFDWRDGPDTYPKDWEGQGEMKSWADTDRTRMSYEEYWKRKSLPQLRELATQYPDLNMIWFDCGDQRLDEAWIAYRMLHAYQPQALASWRVGGDLGDYIIGGDNDADIENIHNMMKRYDLSTWECVGTMNESWGYKEKPYKWKSSEELLYWLVNIVSAGGNYMLNVGPKPDGSFDEGTVERLKDIGSFMRTNGDAIYGSEPWTTMHEGPQVVLLGGADQKKWAEENGIKYWDHEWHTGTGPEDFWFTKSGESVNVIGFVAPENRIIKVKSLKPDTMQITNVKLLGSSEAIKWKQTEEGLLATLPETLPCRFGYALKVR